MQLNAAEIKEIEDSSKALDDKVEFTESLSYEEEMYQKITSGEKLTERELRSLVQEFDPVEEIEGSDHRWTRDVETIVELCGHYYSIGWQRALTECQEHEFWDQPVEVKPHEKWVKETEWVSVDREIKKDAPICVPILYNVGDKVCIVDDAGVHQGEITETHTYRHYRNKENSGYVVVCYGNLRQEILFENCEHILFTDKEKADAEFTCRQQQKELNEIDYEEQEEIEL